MVDQRTRYEDLEPLFHSTVRKLNPAPSALETTRIVVWDALKEARDKGAEMVKQPEIQCA